MRSSIAALARKVDALAAKSAPPLRAREIIVHEGEALPDDAPGILTIARVLIKPKEKDCGR